MLWCTTSDRQERDRCGSILKYSEVVTIQERVLGMQERKIRYKFDSIPK